MEKLSELKALLIPSPSWFNKAEAFRKDLLAFFKHMELALPASLLELDTILNNARESCELLVVLGGDGTVNQVVNRMDLDRQRLAILPFGRGNDLARSLSLPLGVRAYFRKLPEMTFKTIDIGKLGTSYFVNSCGIGLDGFVLSRMKDYSGIWAKNYMLAFLRSLRFLKPFKANLEVPELIRESSYWWIVVMNGRFIGGGIPIAPKAKVDDGKLDLISVSYMPKWRVLTGMLKVYIKQHLALKEVENFQTTQAKISALTPPIFIEVDGELYRWKQNVIELSVMPLKLQVLC